MLKPKKKNRQTARRRENSRIENLGQSTSQGSHQSDSDETKMHKLYQPKTAANAGVRHKSTPHSPLPEHEHEPQHPVHLPHKHLIAHINPQIIPREPPHLPLQLRLKIQPPPFPPVPPPHQRRRARTDVAHPLHHARLIEQRVEQREGGEEGEVLGPRAQAGAEGARGEGPEEEVGGRWGGGREVPRERARGPEAGDFDAVDGGPEGLVVACRNGAEGQDEYDEMENIGQTTYPAPCACCASGK